MGQLKRRCIKGQTLVETAEGERGLKEEIGSSDDGSTWFASRCTGRGEIYAGIASADSSRRVACTSLEW